MDCSSSDSPGHGLRLELAHVEFTGLLNGSR
jgi:hypothetical protein